MSPRRPCLICGTPATGSRCPDHALTRRGHAHALAVKQTLLVEGTCWICGDPARPDDPLTGDHVVPRSRGGADARWNMRAAHSSCNKRRGAPMVHVASPLVA